MVARPFQCSNCKNWYTPAPSKDNEYGCMYCADGTHTPHHKTGVIDCHFGQESSTRSETILAQVCVALDAANKEATGLLEKVRAATVMDTVLSAVMRVESLQVEAEAEYRKVPDAMTWAGVFELPGMAGEAPEKRFKSLSALAELARNNRRPRTDVETLERSVRVCGELQEEASGLMAGVRAMVTEVRVTANNWRAPVGAEATGLTHEDLVDLIRDEPQPPVVQKRVSRRASRKKVVAPASA
jgi:hypothetical protein